VTWAFALATAPHVRRRDRLCAAETGQNDQKRQTMARPRLSDEIKMARGTYRPGRANAVLNGLCESANRRIRTAKQLLDAESIAVYTEAVELIDSEIPHVDGKHGMPDSEALADIEIIERAIDVLLDSIGADEHTRDILGLRSSKLYHLILDAHARAA
jgi:hypothetical protein